ncbi:MAG: HEPN domain-containing protein [Phormidesmis sp.]
MSELDEAKTLYRAAIRDLNALLGMLQVNDLFADEIFGQHVQQAVEKLIKTWLSARGEKYPLIHDLDTLLQMLEDLGCDVNEYWDLTRFTTFGVRFRYEDFLSDSESIQREDVIGQIQGLQTRVETILQSAQADESENKTDGEVE